MMTSAECLAKAAEMDERALQSETVQGREEYGLLAVNWRRNAALALAQEAYTRKATL